MSAPVELCEVIQRAASGVFPAVDGEWQRAQPWSNAVGAVVAMTGHAYLAVHEDPPAETAACLDGFGGAHDPRVIAALAGADGWIDSLDVILVRRRPECSEGAATASADQPRLVERADLARHPRAQLAKALRHDVRVLGLEDRLCTSVVTVGRGLAGLPELGIELDPSPNDLRAPDQPSGAGLLRSALAQLDEPLVVACVAPGNARALRLFLSEGFVAVGSVQLFSRAPDLMRAL